MLNFYDYYLNEKVLNTHSNDIKTKDDEVCINVGRQLSSRFGLKLNGWWEMTYTFTIPKGVPNEGNTFLAKNEKEIIEKLQKRFPEYLEYIMQKNFPDGYKPSLDIPNEPPTECEPLDLNSIGKD